MNSVSPLSISQQGYLPLHNLLPRLKKDQYLNIFSNLCTKDLGSVIGVCKKWQRYGECMLKDREKKVMQIVEASHLNALSPEILYYLLNFIPLNDLAKQTTVNKYFNDVIYNIFEDKGRDYKMPVDIVSHNIITLHKVFGETQYQPYPLHFLKFNWQNYKFDIRNLDWQNYRLTNDLNSQPNQAQVRKGIHKLFEAIINNPDKTKLSMLMVANIVAYLRYNCFGNDVNLISLGTTAFTSLMDP